MTCRNRIINALFFTAVIFLSSCATHWVDPDRLNHHAVITTERLDSQSFFEYFTNDNMLIVSIDNNQVEDPFGPFYLSPGSHPIEMECDNQKVEIELDVKVGEHYIFDETKKNNPDKMGCLSKHSNDN